MRIFTLSLLLTLTGLLALRSVPATGFVAGFFVMLIAVAIRWRIARALVSGALVGVLVLTWSLFQFGASQLQSAQISVDVRLQVRIVGVPAHDGRRLRFTADVVDCLSCDSHFGPRRLQLSWYGRSALLRAGETWELSARLKPQSSQRNPGSFDRIRWSLAKGLHAQGYVREKPTALRISAASTASLSALRENWSLQLDNISGTNKHIGLIQALTLGVKAQVEQASWLLLRDTGTAHLLAISGLHVTLLAGWGYLLGRQSARLMRRFNNRLPCLSRIDAHVAGLLISMVTACAYALMAGFELPVQRALLMLLVWVLCSWRFRVLPAASGLSVALIIVLLHNSLSVLSVGFWLSFGTVAALFYLHQGQQRSAGKLAAYQVDETYAGLRPWLYYHAHRIMFVAGTHLRLGLLVLPLSAWFFQSGSLIAPVANLLAVPWVGFVVVPLCFATLILNQLVPLLAVPALALTQWSLDILLACLSWLSYTFTAAISLSIPGVTSMFLCLTGLLIALAPKGLGIRWLSAPLLLPVLLYNLWQAPIEGFEIHVLDVGQGLAALVLSDGHTLLFDTGGKVSSSLSQFEAVIMPFLVARGRRHIDTLVVSHGDEDHAFGVSDVVRRFPDVRVISSVNLSALENSQTEPCKAGDTFTQGAVIFSFLHPAPRDTGSDNNRSCVLLIHYGASRALLTGDVEQAGEHALLERVGPLPVDLLIAPHHGSRTSSTARFVESFRPSHVVFPSGYRNAYGFPHAVVQLRYKLAGAQLYVTGRDGAISFAFDLTGLRSVPGSWWQSHRRFWHGFVNPACSERFTERPLVLRLLLLAQQGKTLCGK